MPSRRDFLGSATALAAGAVVSVPATAGAQPPAGLPPAIRALRPMRDRQAATSPPSLWALESRVPEWEPVSFPAGSFLSPSNQAAYLRRIAYGHMKL